MKIFRFDRKVGRAIDFFNSVNLIASKIGQLHAAFQVTCFHLGPFGKVGYHEAVVPQLFLVVQGDGWVRNDTSGQVPVEAGRAVYWDKGEWHEAGTNTGLMSIVIEGESLFSPVSMPVAWDSAMNP